MQHAVRESASDSFSLLAWTAIGRGLLLVVDCYWSWTAIGRGLLLVVDCYWSWTAIGCGLLLVVNCCWSWTAIGRGLLSVEEFIGTRAPQPTLKRCTWQS